MNSSETDAAEKGPNFRSSGLTPCSPVDAFYLEVRISEAQAGASLPLQHSSAQNESEDKAKEWC